MVKADAYGHGSGAGGGVVRAGAAWLGVALVEEALELRRAGPGPAAGAVEPHPAAADACAADRIAVTVCTRAGVRAFGMAGRRAGQPVAAHLEVDTGMHRQGCDPAELPALVAAARAEPGLEVEGLWSHLAVADEEPAKTATTDAQLARFRDAWPPRPRPGWSRAGATWPTAPAPPCLTAST